jgi:23S rRNA (uridine2552-2'-O)-methyltransferase
MAPNMSGVDAVDLPRAMHLAELAMGLRRPSFARRGHVPDQAVPGRRLSTITCATCAVATAKVVIRKPAASRKRSPEVYALAQGKLAQMK